MSFWDSFTGAVDSVASNAENLFDKGIKIYSAKTKFDTAKANQQTARTVAELNAQAQVLQIKNAINQGAHTAEEQAPFLEGPQTSPIVINKQTEPSGLDLKTLFFLGLIAWGVANAG